MLRDVGHFGGFTAALSPGAQRSLRLVLVFLLPMKRPSPSSLSRFSRCLWSLLPVLLMGAVAPSAQAQWTQQTFNIAVPGDPTDSLKGIWFADATHAWASDGFGVMAFWDGSTWSTQTYPSPGAHNPNWQVPLGIYGIWGTDANHVWAVGEHGDIIFWNGSSWADVTPGSTNTNQLRCIWGIDANHIWVGGANNTTMFWNGSTWTVQTPTYGFLDTLMSMWGADANHIWAVTALGDIFFFNGTSWTVLQTTGTSPPTNTGASLNGVWGIDANHVWAVGTGGTIMFWNGTTWAPQTSGVSQILQKIWGTDANHIWAIGNSNGTTATVLFWNGTSWAVNSPPTGNFFLFGVGGWPSSGIVTIVGAGTRIFNSTFTLAAPSPTVTVPGGTTTLTTTTSGLAGTSVSFNISGANLTGSPGNLTVSAPANVEVSANNATWGGTASIPYSSATLASTPVYVRLAGTGTPGSISGNVSITGGGLSAAVTQAVSGTLNAAPSPTVTNVTATTADGSYKAGASISITVTFSASVTVTGTPTLALNSGGSASYSSGSGTSTLTFSYTVAATQNSTDLDYSTTSSLALASSTINASTGGTPATLTLPSPGAAGSLGFNKAIVIDTTAPTILSINRQTPSAQITGSATVTFRVTYSENVVGVTTNSFAVIPANGSNITGTVTGVSGTGNTRDVTVSITSGTGDFRLRGVN